ncbi:MAG: DUF1015 domain-containing protein, partial [Candidatus Limnocylindrales bacterium]
HDVILRHERTRKDKDDDRTRHIVDLRAPTGPGFLVHPTAPAIDATVARATAEPALFEFWAKDGIGHTLWRVSSDVRDALIGAFAAVPRLYIADGHHRAASALRARRALAGPGGEHGAPPVEANGFLAVAFPDDQTRILPYHRYVTDLHGHSPETFLAALGTRVEVHAEPGQPGSAGPASALPDRPGEVAMYLAGRWYALRLPPAASRVAPADGLDVALLQDQVLGPILGIGDPRTDQRIGFMGGIRGAAALAALVDDGQARVAFVLRPVTIGDLMRIADAGGIMPPKSTWFEPKLRDGLLTHLV